YEVERDDLNEVFEETGSSKRSRRGAISVARFKIIGQLIWTRENGIEDDGYWDNQASR
ncbi:MAG: hypothetical protein GY731_13925, partial [Gammaproteobacteria bacterium]|nr:hypothetical protein [Gammaproteobacteria bacterium]